MKVMVAMSGGVDSSVAAALVRDAGHEVTGVTMKLWGGASDTGCCSVADVDDARWAAQQLGVDHLVFNFGDEFTEHVVGPYVADHAAGRTPNPCIECNRHLKFDRLLQRADALGFDAIATGHHARLVTDDRGRRRIARGEDGAKDQSYVLHMLTPDVLDRVLFPIGAMTKAEVRVEAARLGLRTASKPDSQDVCFITSDAGRPTFLGARIPLKPGRVVDTSGVEVGRVPEVELVTIGQRKGLGVSGGAEPRYAIDVDVATATVTVGSAADLLTDVVELVDVVWSDSRPEPGTAVLAQCSAHGRPLPGALTPNPGFGVDLLRSAQQIEGENRAMGEVTIRFDEPQRRVAPGQSVVLYDGDVVLAGGIVR